MEERTAKERTREYKILARIGGCLARMRDKREDEERMILGYAARKNSITDQSPFEDLPPGK